MGTNQQLLKKALANPQRWLEGDPVRKDWVMQVLSKIDQGEVVTLGGDEPAKEGEILIATGGTSGNPRFAIHSWDTLCAAADGLIKRASDKMKSYGILPLEHVSGFMPVVRTIVSGGKLVLGDKHSLEGMDEGMFLSLVPTQLQRFMKDPDLVTKLRSCRMIFVGGAAADEELLEKAQLLELPLAPCYGMTETAAMVTVLMPEEFLMGKRGCGKALPGVDISIDEDNRIHISSPSLCQGYAGSETVLTNPFATQDRGFLDDDGNLHILGRMDHVIITGGEKVNPEEVEAVLKEVSAAQNVLVVGLPDEEWGEKVVAFATGTTLQEGAIKDAAKQRLTRYKVPKQIVVVEDLPLNDQGKVNWELVNQLIRDALA